MILASLVYLLHWHICLIFLSDKICQFHVNEPIVLKLVDPLFVHFNTLCFGYSSIRINRKCSKNSILNLWIDLHNRLNGYVIPDRCTTTNKVTSVLFCFVWYCTHNHQPSASVLTKGYTMFSDLALVTISLSFAAFTALNTFLEFGYVPIPKCYSGEKQPKWRYTVTSLVNSLLEFILSMLR